MALPDNSTITRIYELIDIGIGVIPVLTKDNLLEYGLPTVRVPTLQEVINSGRNLVGDNVILIADGQFYIVAQNGEYSALMITSDTPTPTFHTLALGFLNEFDDEMDQGFKWYSNRTVFRDINNNKGLEYEGDYEANFTARSLITLQYLNNKLAEPTQKIITYPGSFTGVNYTLLAADKDKLIIVDNGATNVTITVPTGLPAEFFSALIRKGTGEVSLIQSVGTTINNAVSGLRINRRYDQVALDKEGSTEAFYLTGNVKV
jgi:hypothetical protein